MTSPEDDLPAALERVTAHGAPARDRLGALREVTVALGRRVRGPAGLVDVVARLAPHVTVRDLATLAAHHDGRVGVELAEELVTSAVRVAAAVGAAGGALASATEAAPPALLSAPVQLAAETLAVVAVELKLILELHVALGAPLPAEGAQRGLHAVRVWTTGRGIGLADLGAGVGGVLGRAARRELRDRLLKRFVRSTLGFLPLLIGAGVGATANARGTRKLGETVLADLRAGRR